MNQGSIRPWRRSSHQCPQINSKFAKGLKAFALATVSHASELEKLSGGDSAVMKVVNVASGSGSFFFEASHSLCRSIMYMICSLLADIGRRKIARLLSRWKCVSRSVVGFGRWARRLAFFCYKSFVYMKRAHNCTHAWSGDCWLDSSEESCWLGCGGVVVMMMDGWMSTEQQR